MIPSKSEYEYCKQIVVKYEAEQARLLKYNGKSKCPFCGGTKTKPFVGSFRSQDCTDCDKNGMISNRALAEMDLTDCIEKPVIK